MLLQEIFGYLLTASNDLQKMFVLLGAKASGKGTIISVIEQLVGQENTTGTSLQSLAGPFGLEPLIGKSVAVDSDARISRDDNRTLILRQLIAVTGNNTQSINRKNKPAIDEHLTTRFVIAANEMPDLDDSTGALKRRILMLRFPHSFEGKEDFELSDKLKAELPFILQWSIEGLRRLRQNKGRFTEAQSGRALLDVLVQRSPLDEYAHERIVLHEGSVETKDDVVADYRRYLEEKNYRHSYSDGELLKKLYGIYPSLVPGRPGPRGGNRVHIIKGMRLVKSRFKPCPKSYLMGLVRYTNITGQPISRDLAIDGAMLDGIDGNDLDTIATAYGVNGKFRGGLWGKPDCASDNLDEPGWNPPEEGESTPDTGLTPPF